ncbi:murein biosynthesis integral membrane protein MurJ [Nakamurella endophytica]|uniref:Murein biosynthesis integral membrane protein MurJ n=1 Tax=Nakamurella endophytica TaxID=1748367 RepID=A0A917SUC7_9ACTN|nr:murein biosynthesis integral membrane protein MurJ [Nakamurella endophytica]GGL96865.1 hypothetical protein GCM10011594_15780 [Nakamurella endophytica]
MTRQHHPDEPPEWFRRAVADRRDEGGTGGLGPGAPALLAGTEDSTVLIQQITDEALPERDRRPAGRTDADTVVTGPGADTVVTGSGADTVVTGSGAATVLPGSAAETVVAAPDAARTVSTGDGTTVVTAAGADAVAGMRTARTSGVVRASALMAVATVVSRITGLLAKVLLAAALGAAVVNNSYTLANTLPNIVFELLIGGVLTSVAIPLLTRAQRSDADGGAEYTQRLVTLVLVGLVAATALSVAAAPLLTRLYLSGSSDAVNVGLATDLARLLLPQIVFYGLAAMFGAILNTRERFAANAWAPVVNNLVVIAVAVVLLRSGITSGADTLSRADALLLGVGTTLGIVAQAAVMLPSLRRSGFRFRWRWGWDRRLGEAGGLVAWAVVYVLVSQVGVVATTRIASGDDLTGGVVIFQTASLLFQMPYGILGVAVLTAIMPRMSRHAAAGQLVELKQDMSLANRLSAVALLPVSAGLLVVGGALSVLLFEHGEFDRESALLVGGTLGGMAVGLLPLAMTLVQMRVFYAMKDGRTPVVINAVMVAVRVPLLFAAASLSPRLVIPGLAVATAASYLVGAVVGEIWLRARFGPMGTRRTLATVGKMAVASAGGGVAAYFGTRAVTGLRPTSLLDALAICVVAAVIGVVVIAVLAVLLRVEELVPVRRRLLRLLGRGRASDAREDARTAAGAAHSRGGDPDGPAVPTPAAPAPARPAPAIPAEGVRHHAADRAARGTEAAAGRPSMGEFAGPAGRPVDPTTVPAAAPAPGGHRPGSTPHPATTEPVTEVTTRVTSANGGPRDGTAGTAGTTGGADGDRPPALSPGATVGERYRLVSLVLTDRAGNHFWRAKDTVLPRDMAITLLADPGAASATVARTLRVGRLHHAGLPQTLDVGTTPDGQSFIAGQWMDGATLTDLLSAGPLEPDVATSITAKVAEAVAEAHRNGIALGALHPSLVRVNFDGQVALSHVIAHGGATPDQDIEAVGALLYAMLTGTWPLAAARPDAPGSGTGAEQDAATVVTPPPDDAARGRRFGRRAAADAEPAAAAPAPPVDDPSAPLPAAPTRLGRELPASQVRPGIPEALSALAERALHPQDPDGIHAVGAIAALLRSPDTAAAPAEELEPEPAESLRPAERRLIRERRVKLAIGATMLVAFSALIVIVVASLAKQALAGVQDPTVSDVGRPAVSSAPAPSSSAGASRTTRSTRSQPSKATTPASRTTGTSTTSTSTTTVPPAAPVPVASATVYDPQGDGNKDNIGQVERAFDNDPSSGWNTFVYKQQFPTLKQGVGLTLELQREAVPTSVTVSSDTPGTKVEIRTATGSDVPLASTRVVGTGLLNGAAPVTIKLDGAPRSKYLIVFVTQLAPQGSGFQSSLTEIAVSGS